jgi:threonylcarbamoyladenosine tRNA methylthiotransferase MtaB
MPQLRGPEIRDRAARLRAAGDARLSRHLAAQAGTTRLVLMEGPRMGRTEQFAEAVFDTDQPEGQIILAEITGTTGQQLTGRAKAA